MTASRLVLACCAALATACGGPPPLATVPSVDLERFSGDWFVIAHLPTRQERNAYDAVEHYDMLPDGRIRIRFTFREGGFDGERRTLRMRAWVHDETTRAEWRVRPFWPLAMDYLVIWLDAEHTVTVVGHPSRDYVWIMARETSIPEQTFATIRASLTASGFDLSNLRMVPHSPR